MNRRNFLKQVGGLLAVIPALAWAKEERLPSYEATPDEHWADDTEEELNGLAIAADGTIYIGGAFVNPPISNDEYWARWNGQEFEPLCRNSDNGELYKWNGAGDSWKSSDGGKTWERWESQAEYEFDHLCLSFEDIHNDFILASNQEYFEGLDEAITTDHR